MKKLLLSIFILSSLFGFAQKLNCDNFKRGVFREVDGEETDETYRIIRNDSIQIEKESVSGMELKQSIEWIDKCKFKLKFISGNKVYQEKYSSVKDTIPLIIDIKIGGVNFYLYEAKYKGDPKVVYTGRILKLE